MQQQLNTLFIVLVAHIGIWFEVAFVFNKCFAKRIDHFLIMQNKFYVLYTFVLSKQKSNLPDKYKMSLIYYYCTGEEATKGYFDFTLQYCRLSYPKFSQDRQKYIYKVDCNGTINKVEILHVTPTTKTIPNKKQFWMSETEDGSRYDESSENEEEVIEVVVLGWREDTGLWWGI